MPTCIAAILSLVRVLLDYGKHLDAILPDHAEHPRFPTLAAAFGTHDIRRILAHVQRGILRAMMLERFLLARAAQGRDIVPTPLPEAAEQADIEALEMKLRPPAERRAKTTRGPRIDPDDPAHFSMPTLKELESQVRRCAVGHTIAQICMDLGITANISEAAIWDEIFQILMHFGGNYELVFGVQERRKQSFQKERNRLKHTWTFDWRDRPREAIRQLLGYVLGETPPRGPPSPQLLAVQP